MRNIIDRQASGRWLAVTAAIAVLVLGASRDAAAQNSTSGAIQGVVSDAATGDVLAGVTVVAASPAAQGTQAEITDDAGQYKITNLPPGTYIVTFYYSELTVRRTGVVVTINKTTPAYVKLDTTQVGGEVIEIKGRTPSVDPTSTTQGLTLDSDYTRNLPVGRSYEEVLGAAAGTSSDDMGVNFSGSSSLENTYIVDGVNTTQLTLGTVGTSIINEFIEETEIITGGYNAEYGRATGGVVNVVTKSGSNEFHGSVFAYGSPGQLRASAEATPTQSSSIDAESKLLYDTDFGFEVGGPILKDKLWFYAGLAPQISREELTRITKSRKDCHTILADGSLSPCDPGMFADGTPDVDPETGFLLFEELDRRTTRVRRSTYQFVSKVNFAVNPEHQGQVSVVGAPSQYDDIGVNGLPSATFRNGQALTTDVSAKWTSKLNDNKTEVEAVVGWHRSTNRSDALDDSFNGIARQNLYYGDLATWGMLGGESSLTMAGCSDGAGDRFPGIDNCPDEGNGYAIGGPGELIDDLEVRYSARLSATQRARALGTHEIKAGVDAEDNRLESLRSSSGGMYFDVFLPHYDEPALTDSYQFVTLAPPGTTGGFDGVCRDTDVGTEFACDLAGGNVVANRTINWAAYLRDSWQVLPNLTLNLGLRYEEQRMRNEESRQNTVDPYSGERLGTNAFILDGMWAPRVGAIYDWTKEGRSKVYAHWGRFFESVPLNLNNVNFAGQTVYRTGFEAANCGEEVAGVGGPDGPGCLAAGEDAMSGSNIYGSGSGVAPGIKPQYLDEALFGVEYEVMEDLKVGIAYHDRRLGRVLEDISPDNTETYILANPGEWSEEEEERLQDQIDAETDEEAKAHLEKLMSVYRGIRDFDTPRRVYQAVQLSASRRFSKNLFVQAAYTYARTKGNFPGLYEPGGAINPNITSQYDLIELLANRDGAMSNDRPHDFKLDAYYIFDFAKAGQVVTGGRFTAQSGVPIDALGSNSIYGFDESFVLPRGTIGRTPFSTGLDVHLAYGRELGKGMKLEVFTDLFNVLNRQVSSYPDETYTQDPVNPVVGGAYEDLLWTKAQDWSDGSEPSNPAPPKRNRNFRNAELRQEPFAARFGLRLTF